MKISGKHGKRHTDDKDDRRIAGKTDTKNLVVFDKDSNNFTFAVFGYITWYPTGPLLSKKQEVRS